MSNGRPAPDRVIDFRLDVNRAKVRVIKRNIEREEFIRRHTRSLIELYAQAEPEYFLEVARRIIIDKT